MSGLDGDTIRHALQVARDRGFRVVKLRLGDSALTAQLLPDDTGEDWPEGGADTEPRPTEKPVCAPCVGYFRPGPDLRLGMAVGAGDKIGEVYALGIANEVTSPISGKLLAVEADEGQAVEFGQILFLVGEVSG